MSPEILNQEIKIPILISGSSLSIFDKLMESRSPKPIYIVKKSSSISREQTQL
jgi:hypothetical protein